MMPYVASIHLHELLGGQQEVVQRLLVDVCRSITLDRAGSDDWSVS